MNNLFSTLFASFGVVLVSIFLFAIFLGFPVWILWNWLMPDIFGLPEIGIWQAFGLTLLARCLMPNISIKK